MKRKQMNKAKSCKIGEPKDPLEQRLQEAAKVQPDLLKLRSLLLALGGKRFCPPLGFEYDLEALLKSGFIIPGPPAIIKKIQSHACHRNVADTWRKNNHGGLVAIATGYALSDDGIWRQHSWGLMPTGICETTVPRDKYFGTLLFDEKAERFASCNDHVPELLDQIPPLERRILLEVMDACHLKVDPAKVDETALHKIAATLEMPIETVKELLLAACQRFVELTGGKVFWAKLDERATPVA